MRRGVLYRVPHPRRLDPKRSRVFVIVSRQTVIDSRFSTVVCAPVYSRRDGLSSQVEVGLAEGLKHASSIHCDALISIPKSALTDYIGELCAKRLDDLRSALRVALDVE